MEQLTIPNNYLEVNEYLSSQYEEWYGYEFYKYIFPNCENENEINSDYSKPNAIYLYKNDDDNSSRKMKRRIMLNDTWEQDYMDYVERNESTLCGGLAYRSRANKLHNAQQCNALIIDLDGVGLKEIRNLFLRFGQEQNFVGRMLPMPTFLVSSGKGLHIYYVLDEPLELFPYIKQQLKSMKHDLTFKCWDYKATSQFKAIQYQSINQGFRMVGSVNSKYGTVVRAYKIGDKVSIDYLNSYILKDKNKVDVKKRFRPSKMTLEQAKIKFPEWYDKLYDENGRKRKNVVSTEKWDIKGKTKGSDPYALYHWWVNRADEVKGGHRYFFLMCMCIYASKCDVPKEKLKEDMKDVFKILSKVEHDNPLTQVDVESALESYAKDYYNFTIADIEKLTDIRIERNKRNGRKQADHIVVMNKMKEVKKMLGENINEGRPPKNEIVKEWRLKNPNGKKIECERELGLSRHTVLKWWNE